MVNQGKRIMIIDDDEGTREILSHAFQAQGYNTIAANHINVITHIAQYSPDVLLLDAGMAILHHNLLKAYKTSTEACCLPVLLMASRHDLPQLPARCQFTDYVNKPFEIEAVLHKVYDILHA